MSIVNSDNPQAQPTDSAQVVDASHRPEASDWAALNSDQSEEFNQGWLQLQCRAISGAYAAVLAVRRSDKHNGLVDAFAPAAIWPQSTGPDQQSLDQLSELIENVIARGEGLVAAHELQDADGREAYGIAYPVLLEQNIVAVVAVSMVVAEKTAIESAMQQLQWGSSWLQLGRLRNANSLQSVANQRMSASLDTLASVLIETDYSRAAMRFISELSIVLQCERVSLGLRDKKGLKLQFLSDSAQFGERMNLVRSIEAAMNEADDQKQTVAYPPLLSHQAKDASQPLNNNVVSLANQALAQDYSDACVVSIPLYVEAECVAVITLERDKDQPFSDQDCEFAESVSALIITALEEKRLNDRFIVSKVFDAFKQQAQRLLGAGYLGRKFAALFLIAVVLFLSLASGEYRLSADARLETSLQHIIAAPYDGYIKQSQVRAGDTVSQNDVLVQLDDRDLRLEKLKAISEKAKFDRQYQEAIADYDRAGIKIIAAQIAQIDAELSLVESKLKRAQLFPPFEGLVISGDLSQRLGGAVSKGEQLFEVSPINAFRVILLIRESRIADVSIGQQGNLFLSALPQQPIAFTVDRMTPVISAIDGSSYFNIEASLDTTEIAIQPGMEGIGKIVVGERKYAEIWSRGLLEWLRLKLWAFWG